MVKAERVGPKPAPARTKVELRVASTEEDILDAYTVRHQVFVSEQKVPPVLEVDARDYLDSTVHFVGHTEEEPRQTVAAGRLLPEQDAGGGGPLLFWVGRVAVVPGLRGTGVGQAMMETIIETATRLVPKQQKAQVFLDAQVSAIGFYSRLGFTPTDKEQFFDAGILHQEMSLEVIGTGQEDAS